MTEIAREYKLEKILLARPDRPGFATPLFSLSGSDKIFMQEIKDGFSEGFVIVPFSSITGHLQDIEEKNVKFGKVGRQATYAFVEPSGVSIVGTKEKLSKNLIANFRSFSSYPFLRTQIAKFIDKDVLLNFASYESDQLILSNRNSTGANDKFEVYQDKRGEYRWRRKASNGQIVGASCEGYAAKADATANMFRGPNDSDKWEFYEDKVGEHRWRRKASNGHIVGASSEGYKAKTDAKANARRQGFLSDTKSRGSSKTASH